MGLTTALCGMQGYAMILLLHLKPSYLSATDVKGTRRACAWQCEAIVAFGSFTDPQAQLAGRGGELAALSRALNAAHHGCGSTVLLSGEPGIGKTRLAEELSTRARHQGGLVLWGRCYEGDGAPAYWPWIQILRGYVQARETDIARVELGTSAADLVALAPELQTRLPEIQPATPIDGEQARFRLFDSLTSALARVAAGQTLVLVLDDLHWADTSSLLLLRHLAGTLASVHILLVGTYRESDIDQHHPLTELIASLARLELTEQLPLGGLAAAQIAELMTATSGRAPDTTLLHGVVEATAGNPFFVTQVARLLAYTLHDQSGDNTPLPRVAIPPGVRAVILQRVQRLSMPCQALLQAAAVIGRECSLRLLRALDLGPHEAILRALDEADRAKLLVPAAEGLGHHRFVHALVREAIYDALPLAARTQLHARVGQALIAVAPIGSTAHLAEIAYHLFQAAPAGNIELALDYSLRAAAQSSALLAYEDAVLHYARALQLLDLLPLEDAACRCDVLLAQGEMYARSGAAHVHRTFAAAAALAHDLSDVVRLARSALGLAGMVVTPGVVDAQVVALLEEALAALGEGDSALRARLLGRLAMEYRYSPLREQRDTHSAQALEIARRLGDPAELAIALQARHYALLAPDTLDQRMAISIELSHLADTTGNRELVLRSMPWRVADLLDLGHVQAADRAIAEAELVAAELRQPLYVWYVAMFRAQRSLMQGELAEGERLAEQALVLGRQVQPSVAQIYYAAQLFVLRREQGRAGELVPMFRSILAQHPGMPIFRCWLALAQLQAGQAEVAAALLTQMCVDRCAALPWDQLWLGSIVVLAEVAVLIEDRASVALLYDLLLPFAERNVMVGVPISLGAAALYLGQMAECYGDHSAAEQHYQHAVALHIRLDMRALLVRTQVAYAAFLERARQPERAAALLSAARAAVDPTEQPMLAAEIAGIAASASSATPPYGLTERELATLRLLASGQPTKAIAQRLAVSISTVERYITHLYAKIGVRSRAEATAFALRHQLL